MSDAMIHPVSRGAGERPTYQWETLRGGSALALRLFGTLGKHELGRVVVALLESGASPRDFIRVEFEDVDHLDYRSLPEFTTALQRLRDRGASLWFVGLSPYVRALFHVAGQGPALARLEWRAQESEPSSLVRRPVELRRGDFGPAREGVWGKTGI